MKDKSIALMSFLAMLFMITVLFIFIAFGGAKMAKCDKWIITIIMGVICVVIVLTVVLHHMNTQTRKNYYMYMEI